MDKNLSNVVSHRLAEMRRRQALFPEGRKNRRLRYPLRTREPQVRRTYGSPPLRLVFSSKIVLGKF
jgi:hypothetical protein